jgi:hypothetical protein
MLSTNILQKKAVKRYLSNSLRPSERKRKGFQLSSLINPKIPVRMGLEIRVAGITMIPDLPKAIIQALVLRLGIPNLA